jgi:hypothetical protein
MTQKTQRWVFSVIVLVIIILSATHASDVLSQSECYDPNPHDNLKGYCDHWGNFVPGYITNDTWFTSSPKHVTGKMVFYGPSVMKATADYRGMDYDGCIGGVALMSPMDIGKRVWIKTEGKWFGPFCSVDCARKGDMYSVIVHRDEVIEVEFAFAERLGMVSLVPRGDRIFTAHEWYRDVEIYIATNHAQSELPNLKNSIPIDYSEWFLDNLEFAQKWEPRVIPTKEPNIWRLWGHDVFWYDAGYWADYWNNKIAHEYY